MTALQGAVKSAAPVSSLRLQSFEVADFPVPTGREEEWRITLLPCLRGLPQWGPDKITEDGRGPGRPLPAQPQTELSRLRGRTLSLDEDVNWHVWGH
jgi:hypothetical protein